jgi:hypothetical protein
MPSGWIKGRKRSKKNREKIKAAWRHRKTQLILMKASGADSAERRLGEPDGIATRRTGNHREHTTEDTEEYAAGSPVRSVVVLSSRHSTLIRWLVRTLTTKAVKSRRSVLLSRRRKRFTTGAKFT